MKFRTLLCCHGSSRYQVLVAILLVLCLQLFLWICVLFKPSTHITIYFDSLDIKRNQLEFSDAFAVQDKTQGRYKNNFIVNETYRARSKHRNTVLERLKILKQEKRDHPQLVRKESGLNKNVSDPALVQRAALYTAPWTSGNRRLLLDNLEPSLFTEALAPLSDSSCSLQGVDAPRDLCRRVAWHCNHCSTFTTHHRHNRTLTVNCPGDFKVDWYFERDGGLTDDVMKNYTNRYSEWSHVAGPINIAFPTQYADVMCRVKEDNGTMSQHNYRTQFLANEDVITKQHKVFNEMKSEHSDWQPLSILSINIDSLSRVQFHRSCGLPKTRKLLRRLYKASTESSHQAFLFSHFNAIGGVTAMNLTPLYAGMFFKRADEERRVLNHRYTKPIKEWMWDYANQHGFLTSYGLDTGNGIMGTRTVCRTCNHLPVELPHWEHGWIRRENEEVAPGVLSGLCDGDTMIHEHIMNYTRDFLNHDYPAKWAAFDLNAKHRPEQESGNQVDALLAETLEALMASQPNLTIFLFGDHGDRYHGDFANHSGSYMEIMLPFLAIILPRHVLDSHPGWERNLLINSQRYVVHYDLHHTMKSLMDYPNLHKVKGHIVQDSYNLLTQVIPRERGCDEANIPNWSCACGGPTVLKKADWTEEHISYAQLALDDINAKHSKEALLGQTGNHHGNTSCMDLHLDAVVDVARIRHDYAGLHIVLYIIIFDAIEGPSRWDLKITEEGQIESLKQVSRYQKYEHCQDPRVSIEFCVCQQFPPGTP